MSSFAYQGFGFGEYFRGREQLNEILDTCFLGVFDAPSSFLSLARRLEGLADDIEHLFDENSNPNSAILRSDNRIQAQQLLRISSHGLIDNLKEVMTVLPIDAASKDRSEQRGYNMVFALRLAGEEWKFGDLTEKFSFQQWKLSLFFKVLRKSKVAQTLNVYEPVQKRIGEFLDNLIKHKGFTSMRGTTSQSISSGSSSDSASHGLDLVQRFQDACSFGTGTGNKFVWKLKPESTLLITMHWIYQLRKNDLRARPAQAYVCLLKCAWLMQVSTPAAGVEGYSDEMRTMIGLVACELVYRLQEFFEYDRILLNPKEVAQSDFSIYVKSVNKELGTGVMRTAMPQSTDSIYSSDESQSSITQLTAPRSPTFEEAGYSSNRHATIDGSELSAFTLAEYGRRGSTDRAGEYLHSLSTQHFPASSSSSQYSDPDVMSVASSAKSPTDASRLPRRQSSTSGERLLPDYYYQPSGGLALGRPKTDQSDRKRSNTSSALTPPTSPASRAPRDLVAAAEGQKTRVFYSWNEVVDRANLGVRPGEIEILPRDFEAMHLEASYTGDMHGRWDECSLRIFKFTEDSTIRILTMMEGSSESIDQRIAYVKEAELVPDYGYRHNHPVVYMRKTHRKSPFASQTEESDAQAQDSAPSSLYYRFKSAHDMFTLQLALLGESVELDLPAVRTVRFKKSIRDGEHVHYRARLQLWREEDTETHDVLSSEPSIAPTLAASAWQSTKVKIHNTRLVMYWDKGITTLFVTDSIDLEMKPKKCSVRIKPSQHKKFGNPTTVKAKGFGNREKPGGFRLDKKGLFPADEEAYDDFKWFELEFHHAEEMQCFNDEFKRALNLRRKERWHAEELKKLAARGVHAGQVVR